MKNKTGLIALALLVFACGFGSGINHKSTITNADLQSSLTQNPSGDAVYLQVGQHVYDLAIVGDSTGGQFRLIAGNEVSPLAKPR